MTTADSGAEHDNPTGPTGKRLCGAKRLKFDEHCTRPAGWGTDHPGFGRCKLHGGATASHRRASAEARATEGAVALLDAEDIVPTTNPLQAVAMLCGEAIAFKDAAGSLLAALQDDLRYQSLQGAEQLRAEVAIYERALDRAGRFAMEMSRLNLDERLVRIDEANAALFADAFDRALAAVELTAEEQAQLKAAMVRELTKMP